MFKYVCILGEKIDTYMISVVVGKFSYQCQEMHWLDCVNILNFRSRDLGSSPGLK